MHPTVTTNHPPLRLSGLDRKQHVPSPTPIVPSKHDLVVNQDKITNRDHIRSTSQDTMNNPFKGLTKFSSLANLPSLGPGDSIGEGDSSIKYDLLPKDLRDEINPNLPLSDTIFRALYHEVHWEKMYHAAGEVPRLVAVQGVVNEDGSKPVYRHPSDQAPSLLNFTKYVNIVRQEAEKAVGHPLNHVLIQLYRSGQDYISEHSDKTLDIAKGSSIVNASFGAQRTMRLRTKRSAKKHGDDSAAAAEAETKSKIKEVAGIERITQRIHMPHNSLFILGLKTNRFWLHGITQDKRAERDRAHEELANNSMRISLTFRHIDTFLSADEQYIWGQGAKSKDKTTAGKCINADAAEAEKIIDAFGVENKEGAGFDWARVYGEGFDVLNMRAAEEPEADAEERAAIAST
jgi:alkylated DNA repair dioxygenase AlkB